MRATLIILITCLLLGCGKKATKVNINYQGSWSNYLPCDSTNSGNYNFFLTIDNKSFGRYSERTCNSEVCDKRKEGKVKIRKGTMKVGLFFKLTITQEPTAFDTIACPADGVQVFWKMKLNGRTYYRKSK